MEPKTWNLKRAMVTARDDVTFPIFLALTNDIFLSQAANVYIRLIMSAKFLSIAF